MLPGGVTSQNGAILLHGQPVQVMMDGRELTGMDPAVLLKALPSSALSQIELISDKGARHDASTAAVINIIPVKKISDGWNMDLNANASLDMEKHFDPGGTYTTQETGAVQQRADFRILHVERGCNHNYVLRNGRSSGLLRPLPS